MKKNINLKKTGFFKKNGSLTYGEIIIPGKSTQEIFISTYVCHPSMANNELSGPLVSTALIKHFQSKKKLEKTLRFIFIPETIGSITYLSKNLKKTKSNFRDVENFEKNCHSWRISTKKKLIYLNIMKNQQSDSVDKVILI